MQHPEIIENKELNLIEALIPVVGLLALLFYNIKYAEGVLFGDYSNQVILLIAGLIAAAVGLFNKVTIHVIFYEVWVNWKSVFVPILILFLVGALAGTWLVSGVIPAMVYYGLQVLNPTYFLPASVVISAIIAISTGSSWGTSATVGIALIGIGSALGISTSMIAGSVISGAYFGDKMSPLSDTTNLAPAMAGTDIFSHIRYMTLTTVPSIIITLIVFFIIGINLETTGVADMSSLLLSIKSTFKITPYLFIVPLLVIVLILLKTKPLMALSLGVVAAMFFAFIYQSHVLSELSPSNFKSIIRAVFVETQITTENKILHELFNAGGMMGMISTNLIIVCAMVFGGVMDAIGALSRITSELLKLAKTTFGLFASTVFSCLGLNVIASDQYLAIVIPGKMFKKAYDDKGLAPENLSRALEDSGTVTSVLVPWNTCGVYQASVLGVDTLSYFAYAVFNYVSPFMTLVYAAFNIKIRQLKQRE